ncbi:MAG: glutaredoxin family protein [Betaproteobacteria bacterium]|jgi:glutaredoxin|nr:glutaredoxin family protein [Rubrivivax sp.]
MKPSVRRIAPLLAVLLLGTGFAQAQFKVVAPDGSVTYTDRPPASPELRVTPMGRNAVAAAAPASAEVALPLELRTAVQRHPVTLYTGEGCAPCDTARRLLVQRGIPFSERRIVTEEDTAALERLVGARSIPSLMVGNQPLRGFSDADWTNYLDAAGYPRQSRLPRNWQAQPPRPLVERATPVAAAPAEPAAAPAEADSPAPSGIRF